MIPGEIFKIFGITSIAIIWLGLLFVLYKWPGNASMSFSLHAAQTKAGQLFYLILFLVSLPLFYLFIIQWFVPTFQFGWLFVTLVTIGVIGQFVAVLVPALPGKKELIHNAAAYTMGLTFIPLSFMIALADVSIVARYITGAAIVYMLMAPLLYAFVRRTHAYYLYFQAAYILAFHIIVLVATYIR